MSSTPLPLTPIYGDLIKTPVRCDKEPLMSRPDTRSTDDCIGRMVTREMTEKKEEIR